MFNRLGLFSVDTGKQSSGLKCEHGTGSVCAAGNTDPLACPPLCLHTHTSTYWCCGNTQHISCDSCMSRKRPHSVIHGANPFPGVIVVCVVCCCLPFGYACGCQMRGHMYFMWSDLEGHLFPLRGFTLRYKSEQPFLTCLCCCFHPYVFEFHPRPNSLLRADPKQTEVHIRGSLLPGPVGLLSV